MPSSLTINEGGVWNAIMNKNLNDDAMIEFILKTHIDHYLNQTFPDSHPIADMLSKPLPGAHLVTPRFGYTHHGIYIGNDKVIHYSGFADDFNSGPVEEVSLVEFRGKKGFKERAHNNSVFSNQEIVSRAKSRLNESKYSLVFNNCEHFVNWCIYDVKKSEQVDTAITAGSKTLPATKHVYEGLKVVRSVKAYRDGKISKEKFKSEVAEAAFSSASTVYYGGLGQAAIPIPIVGFLAGAALGIVVSNSVKNTGVLSFGAHSAAVAAKKRREEIERMSERIIPILEEAQLRLEAHFEQVLGKKQKALGFLFNDLGEVIKGGDTQSAVEALNDVSKQFNSKLSFTDEEDFKNKYF